MTGALATLLQESFSGGGRLTSLPTGKEINYDAVNASAEALAFSLKNSGLMPNEPVHVSIANRSEDLSAMLGVWLAGGVVVPVHAFAASRTIQGMQTATGARFIVDRESIIQVATSPPVPRELLAEAALIIFTSGTTGKPKGVVITHSAFSGKLEVLRNLLKICSEDVVLLPLQLTFIFGIWAAFLTIISKGNLILVRKFDNDVVTKVLADSATVLVAVPSLLRTIFTQSLPQARHLRMILTGGESFAPVLSKQASAAWPNATIIDLYGSTETGSCDFSNTVGDQTGDSSIGRPTDNVQFRIVDAFGKDVAGGLAGELLVRTPYRMAGYLDNPALTLSSFIGGYYRTGDLVRLLPDRSVSLVGRLKEIVSRGGNKIAPQEIDNLLSSHPSVESSLTTGMPDLRLGETIYSAVVLAPGHRVTPGDLRNWLSERIEKFKIPEKIVIMGVLPTGPTGKVSREALKKLFVARQGERCY